MLRITPFAPFRYCRCLIDRSSDSNLQHPLFLRLLYHLWEVSQLILENIPFWRISIDSGRRPCLP